jgi:predicted RNA-binding Zn-ribbon protein involved in translation (DUF1610 family)
MEDTDTHALPKLAQANCKSCDLSSLPFYLQKVYTDYDFEDGGRPIPLLTLHDIRDLPLQHDARSARRLQHFHLLLLREHVTQRMCKLWDESKVPFAVFPELILERAQAYEALGYADLALADAYAAFSVSAGEEEDLRPFGVDGIAWNDNVDVEETDTDQADDDAGSAKSLNELQVVTSKADSSSQPDFALIKAKVKRDALAIMVRSLASLGLGEDISTWSNLLSDAEDEVQLLDRDGYKQNHQIWSIYDDLIVDKRNNSMHNGGINDAGSHSVARCSRREVYPWNIHEPADRTSNASLREINSRLLDASDGCIEAKRTILPFMKTTDDAFNTTADNSQIGLFAARDLDSDETILREHSILTAIRPHDAPLCDACAGELPEDRGDTTFSCPGCGIPFCSLQCQNTALQSYHAPNTDDETTDLGFPPATSPFCPGRSGNADVHDIGRAESSEDPEWDLYLLLVARCIMMSEKQNIHPLDLIETKWLWGDFNSVPDPATSKPTTSLPFSLQHSLLYPHQFFTTLLSSDPKFHPYSRHWLENYDHWILQTLYAKFRGVADARQSTWDGKAEAAGVYGLWCLGNHSCGPNVHWDEKREGDTVGRRYVVRPREDMPWLEKAKDNGTGQGIKKGEQIWNHYTDVTEPDYRIRRARLREVLGGECMCERCVREEAEATAK